MPGDQRPELTNEAFGVEQVGPPESENRPPDLLQGSLTTALRVLLLLNLTDGGPVLEAPVELDGHQDARYRQVKETVGVPCAHPVLGTQFTDPIGSQGPQQP